MTQKLVAYFSATGVTRNVAKQLAQAPVPIYLKSNPPIPIQTLI